MCEDYIWGFWVTDSQVVDAHPCFLLWFPWVLLNCILGSLSKTKMSKSLWPCLSAKTPFSSNSKIKLGSLDKSIWWANLYGVCSIYKVPKEMGLNKHCNNKVLSRLSCCLCTGLYELFPSSLTIKIRFPELPDIRFPQLILIPDLLYLMKNSTCIVF